MGFPSSVSAFDQRIGAQVWAGIPWRRLGDLALGRGDYPTAITRYERALAGFELVPVTAEVAATAARLRATSGLRLPDALQAATAIECGAVALVTHDRDFSRLQGLRVVTGAPGTRQA